MGAQFSPEHEHYCWAHRGNWKCGDPTCTFPHEESCPNCDEELDEDNE